MAPEQRQELDGRLFAIEAVLSRLMTDLLLRADSTEAGMETLGDLLRGPDALPEASVASAAACLTRILESAKKNADHLKH